MMDSSSSKLFTHSAVEQRDELEDVSMQGLWDVE